MSALDVETQRTAAAPRDEAALVARIRAGDEGACEALYLRYHEPLWRFAYAFVRSRDDAEEMVQDVFLALWRNRAQWTVRTSARTWLYAAVRHHALNHLRHERVVARLTGAAEGVGARARQDELRPFGMGSPPPDAEATVEAQELDDAVARALATLPERRRLAMTLRWKHDLSSSEIAVVLDTTPESVRVLLTRARQEIASHLGRA